MYINKNAKNERKQVKVFICLSNIFFPRYALLLSLDLKQCSKNKTWRNNPIYAMFIKCGATIVRFVNKNKRQCTNTNKNNDAI